MGGAHVADALSLYPPEWDDPSATPSRPDDPRPPEAEEPAAVPPQKDYWELRGNTIIRHIKVPRTQLFRPTDDLEGIPVPPDQIDVTRDFETTSSFQGEGIFRDVWDGTSDNDHRNLSEPWTGLIRFYKVPEMTSDGKMIVKGRETRVQVSDRPDHVISELWNTLSRKQKRLEKEYARDIVRARET